jgi:tetratricopeptide (TPR) repeat protein
LNSDILFGDIFGGTESKFLTGVSIHNLLFLLGSSIVAVFIAFSLGYSSWGLLLFGLPILLYPAAMLSIPILEIRPWLIGSFWMLLSIFSFVQAIETRKGIWHLALCLGLFIGVMSFPPLVGLGLGIASITLLHKDRDSEVKPKPIIIASILPVILYFVARLLSDVALPELNTNGLSASVSSLMYALLPLSDSADIAGGSALSLAIGMAVFALILFLAVRYWILSDSSKEDNIERKLLYGIFGRTQLKDSTLSGKVIFLLCCSGLFAFFYNSFNLIKSIELIDIDILFSQVIPIGISLILSLLFAIKLNGKNAYVLAAVLSLLSIAVIFVGKDSLKDQENYLSFLGIGDDYLSEYYLDRARARMEEGDYVEPLELINKSQKLSPQNPRNIKMRGMYHVGAGDLVKAQQYLYEFIEKEGYSDKDVSLAIANIEISLTNYEKAQEVLGQTLSYFPADKEAMALYSVSSLKDNDFRQAADWAKEVIEQGYVVDYLAIEFLNYGVKVFEDDENIALEAWDISGQLNPNYIKPYEKFLVYYVEFFPDFRRALWCVDKIRERGGTVSPAVLQRIYEITPPSMRPDIDTFNSIL